MSEMVGIPLRVEIYIMKLGKRGYPVNLRSGKDAQEAHWLTIS